MPKQEIRYAKISARSYYHIKLGRVLGVKRVGDVVLANIGLSLFDTRVVGVDELAPAAVVYREIYYP